MSSATRKSHRRLKKKLKIGDWVTWGHKHTSHQVLEIKSDGIIVDVSDDPDLTHYEILCKFVNGKYQYFVPFAKRGEANIEIVDGKFDKR